MTQQLSQRLRPDGLVRALIALLLLLCAFPALAQTFPPLTGRVVDAANLFTPEQEAAFDAKLAAVEQSTGRQFVIATIPDLEGYDLSDYGYRLGRAWGIGDKGKNNGVVMFVAPNNPPGQRGPRIEVGYGLEPVLTDAFSSTVAMGVMTPMLKQGDIAGAFDKGIDLVAEQMKLTPEEAAKRTAELEVQRKSAERGVNPGAFIFWLFVFFFVILPIVGAFSRGRGRRHRSGIGEAILWTAVNAAINSRNDSGGSGWSSGGSDWGGGGGGFSGGGGSFGGGGASGDGNAQTHSRRASARQRCRSCRRRQHVGRNRDDRRRAQQ